MKLRKEDVPLLRNSSITFVGTILISMSLLYSASSQTNAYRTESRAAQQQLHAAQSELIHAQQARLDLDEYGPDYSAALQHHLIGEEARLDWIDILEGLRAQNPSVDFHYQIAAQQPYTHQPDSGDFDVMYSAMSLHLTLAHEMQLLDFLDALQQRSHGRFLSQGCVIRRNADTLDADCTGGWITLQHHGAP